MNRAIAIAILTVAGVSSAAGAVGSAAAPATAICPSFRSNDQYPLRLCDKGDPIGDLQFGLRVTVAPTLAIDGYFGPSTLAAVRLFQQHGLAGQVWWGPGPGRL